MTKGQIMIDFNDPTAAAKFARETAIKRALALLDNLGAVYLVKIGEESFGTLVEAAVLTPKGRRPWKKKNNFAQTGYIDKIKAMKVGDALTLECAPELRVEFQSACSGSCAKAFGPGKCMTQQVNAGVCVVRVE